MNRIATAYLIVCFLVTTLFMGLAVFWLIQDSLSHFSLEQRIIEVTSHGIKINRSICSSYDQDVSLRHNLSNAQTKTTVFIPSQFFIVKKGCHDYIFVFSIPLINGSYEYHSYITRYLNPLLSHEIQDVSPLTFVIGADNASGLIPPSP